MGLAPRELEKILETRPGQKVPVLRIFGELQSATAQTSDLGPYTKFGGKFQAVNLISKEVARSSTLLVPVLAEQFLLDGLDAAKEVDDTASIKFGLDILIEENKSTKGGWKFKYAITPLTDFGGGKDVLTEMGEKLGAVPYLEAPAKK